MRATGRIAITRTTSTRGYWIRALRPSIVTGLMERYQCVLADRGRTFETGHAGIRAERPIAVTSHGGLPLQDVDHLVILALSRQTIATRWNVNADIRVPPDVAAELQFVMHTFGLQRIGIYILIDGGDDEQFVSLNFDRKAWPEIARTLTAFTESIATEQEPEPDHETDAALIIALLSPDAKAAPADLSANKDACAIAQKLNVLTADKAASDKKSRELDEQIKPLQAQLSHYMADAPLARFGELGVKRRVVNVAEQNRPAYAYTRFEIIREASKLDKEFTPDTVKAEEASRHA